MRQVVSFVATLRSARMFQATDRTRALMSSSYYQHSGMQPGTIESMGEPVADTLGAIET